MKPSAGSSERRAPVQADGREVGPGFEGDRPRRPKDAPGAVPGTIAWWEHEEAWKGYDAKWRCRQSAETIAERGGFGWWELVEFLGHEPTTWEAVPRGR